MGKFLSLLVLLALFGQLVHAASINNPVALLAPGRPHVEDKGATLENGPWQADILISLMEPWRYENIDMDMPQMFALFESGDVESPEGMERRDLLEDMEEIRYLDKKAWSANVALSKVGPHIFVLESKPWWDEKDSKYRQYLAKSIIFSGAADKGWNKPAGLRLEIMPLTRPMGLYSPCLFSGQVLQEGKAAANIAVTVGHINENGTSAATPWHGALRVMTDSEGLFSVVLNEPGWWYCEAAIPGEPLKGSDGEIKPLELSSVFWLYVDPAPGKADAKLSFYAPGKAEFSGPAIGRDKMLLPGRLG